MQRSAERKAPRTPPEAGASETRATPAAGKAGPEKSPAEKRAADKAAVLAAIERAFAGVPRDETCTLHQALLTGEILINEMALRELSDEEVEQTRQLDSHRHWRDIPAEHLDRCDDALAFLTCSAWRFYLPAYLARALDVLELPIWQTSLLGTVVFELELPTDDFGQRCFALERYVGLDEKQAAAVAAFLRYVAEHAPGDLADGEDALAALERYWGLPPARRPKLPTEPIPFGRVPLH